ncbi:MAG: KTSC domain-containing protein [Candidatus Riesia sp.]|nr:KTSC domain-containing protein [Candidatus Riesia sp.]
MKLIRSDMIRGASYDSKKQTLTVVFTNYDFYKFYGVSKSLVRRLYSAKSKGKFFNKEIKNKFPFKRIGEYHG